MRSIGLRATPSKVFYTILEREDGALEVLTTSHVVIPDALEIPDRLRFLRTTLLDIMDEYQVRRAGIRLMEFTARRVPWFRVQIEGVIQELLASSPVERYFHGPIATIASLLGEADRRRIKTYVDGEEVFMGLNGWAELSQEERESVITAVAALAEGL